MFTSILAAIAGIATIVGAGYGIFKYVTWRFSSTPEEKKEAIDQDVDKEEKKFDDTGRPTW